MAGAKKTSKKPAKSVKKATPVSAVNSEITKSKPRKLSKYLLFGFIIAAILVAAYLLKGVFVAATVNGRPVSRLTLVRNLEKAQGKEALNNLIIEELISQQARKENIVVSNEEVQKEIEENWKKPAEAEGSTLDAALAMRGLTPEGLEKGIRLQKTVQKLLSSELSVSEDEIKKYFEDNKELYGGKDAKYEDLKDSVKNDLEQDRFSTAFQDWYQKLQNESSIKYYVNY